MTVDLLLLNATNLPWRPIFPYAFVQVSAVARRNGLVVRTLDLLDVPREHWAPMLRRRLDAEPARMVGLHIRQGDSVFLDDYYAPPGGPDTRRDYFPIDDNHALVRTLRDVTRAPIIAGGFGFTTHAHRLFDHLGVDYGVQGDPDDVFARFEDVLAGRDLGSVRSLIHRTGGKTTMNERGYFMPFEGPEYTPEIFDELVRFYGHAQLFGKNPPTVPVEVMRGCPFSCFFCTEPHVKGRNFRYRDLAAVEQDLDFLMARQIRRFWMICSELDVQGVKFGLQLAELFIKLQERHGGRPVEWSAYALPRLEEDELRLLMRAGYAGALNDVLSLDDANLRAARVPYRSKQAVAFLKAVTKLDREESASLTNAANAEAKVRAGLTQRTPKELAAVLGLFLGNAHATPATISNTLRRIDEEGLQANYRMGLPFPATRVFAPGGDPICETTPRGLRTYGREGDQPIDFAFPTYYYSDFLVERLGGPDEIIAFMRYVGETFMSTAHRAKQDWSWFLSRHVTAEDLVELHGAITAEQLRDVLHPSPAGRGAANVEALRITEHVLSRHDSAGARVREALGVPAGSISNYRLAEQLYRRFDDVAEVRAAVAPATAAERLYLEWLLYAHHVEIRPAYRELLFGTPDRVS